ncbi:MAG: hypothetical protein HY513_01910 [Candidatus Aenigmarchaeota archaeon]|nr:hypothetical protein [Candidatus Aenigmarchaeota archaeon]
MSFQDYASIMLEKGKDAEKLRERSLQYEQARQEAEALQPVLAALDELKPEQLGLISEEAKGIREKAKPKFDGDSLAIMAYAGQANGRLSLIVPVEVDEDANFLEAATLGHVQESLRSGGKNVKKTVTGGFAEFTVNVDDPREVKKIMEALVKQPQALTLANVSFAVEYGTFESYSGNGQRARSATRKALLPAPAEREYRKSKGEKAKGGKTEGAGAYSRENGKGLDGNILAYLVDHEEGTKQDVSEALEGYTEKSVAIRIGVLKREGYLKRIRTDDKKAVYAIGKKKIN